MKYKIGQIIISKQLFKKKELSYFTVVDVAGIPVVQHINRTKFNSRSSLETLSMNYFIFESLEELKLALL